MIQPQHADKGKLNYTQWSMIQQQHADKGKLNYTQWSMIQPQHADKGKLNKYTLKASVGHCILLDTVNCWTQ